MNLGPQSGASRSLAIGEMSSDFEHRVYRNLVVVLQAKLEAGRLAVYNNEIDFRVRHADRLDRVLYRWSAGKRAGELRFAPVKRQKVVELFVEPEPGCIFRYHALFER